MNSQQYEREEMRLRYGQELERDRFRWRSLIQSMTIRQVIEQNPPLIKTRKLDKALYEIHM